MEIEDSVKLYKTGGISMLRKKEYKFWFCTGSQDLYGDECLSKVAEHSKNCGGFKQFGASSL
jgi:hypothetical protein